MRRVVVGKQPLPMNGSRADIGKWDLSGGGGRGRGFGDLVREREGWKMGDGEGGRGFGDLVREGGREREGGVNRG